MNKRNIVASRKRFKKYEQPLKEALNKILALFPKLRQCSFDIFLVDSSFINKNVLAYPAPKNFPRPDAKNRFLGEIYLNPDYIKKQGENIFYMFIHGFLHLLGYIHKKKSDRIKMEKKEKELLLKITPILRKHKDI